MLIPWIFFLKDDEQLLVESLTKRYTVEGPSVHFTLPLQRITRRRGISLGPTEYLRIRDRLTGELHNETGPKMYFQKATEEVLKRFYAITLKHNEYVRLIDRSSGVIRVEKGESVVYLSPSEEILEEVKPGINIDEQTAVLVRDTVTGGLFMITDPQVYTPAPNHEVVEVRSRIRLEDHDTVVVRQKDGSFVLHRGCDQNRSFFLGPYDELVKFRWSSGLHKEKRDLSITHLDSRPKFMWYEFGARTKDNVELLIGITFFWQIENVKAMISTTDDAPGDICSHARSMIIQSVSQVSLEKFLSEFNQIVHETVIGRCDSFYTDRGVRLHAVEVRSITCKEDGTQKILQEIIQETTNRLNKLQKQESENEVRLRQIHGETEAERLKGELLEIRKEHELLSGRISGESEAERVQAFLQKLGDMPLTEKVSIFNTLRKKEILEKLSEGRAQIYFTPSDINLSIESLRQEENF